MHSRCPEKIVAGPGRGGKEGFAVLDGAGHAGEGEGGGEGE